MSLLLEVKQLYLQFDSNLKRNVLFNLNFTLNHGESLLLLGPSGCGKSTLTFCLNGLFPRELDGEFRGEILINGKQTTDYRPGEISQQVGVVFQDPETQFCMLTVEDEIAFGLENIRISHERMEQRINYVLELVQMLDLKKSAINSLSGGQKQKLALACILALEPSLIILDEPTANLDPIATKEVIQTIQSIQEQTNCALIIIEHQLDGWTDLAQRCLLMNHNGRVFYDGSLREAIRDRLPEIIEQGIWLPKVTHYLLDHMQQLPQELPLRIEELVEIPFNWNALIIEESDCIPSKTQNGLPIMEVASISWNVKESPVLHDISLILYENEFIAIIGANGSGKTSLSRILAGIQNPTTGSVSIEGKKLSEWKESSLRKKIGYVFQNPEHQFITNSVYDEVACSLRLRNVEKVLEKEKVLAVLKTCGLLEVKHEHPYTLSQGQKRRLSVATMIVDDRSLLLLDEPTIGQDASSNAKLMKLLKESYESGTSMVMITHDMELIHDYATRVIVLNEGTIVADLKPADLWDLPAEKIREWKIDLPIPIKIQNCLKREADHLAPSP